MHTFYAHTVLCILVANTILLIGLDFKNEGKQWTQALCEMDSDGDGPSNGFELGDPNCIWQEGDTPTHTMGITHPGVSDLERDESGGQLDTCAEFDFNSLPSNYMTNEFLMKPFQVPSKQTTYAKWAKCTRKHEFHTYNTLQNFSIFAHSGKPNFWHALLI